MRYLKPAVLLALLLVGSVFVACSDSDNLEQVEVSPLLSGGDSWSFTFDEPGTYAIRCRPHPHMRQTVQVAEPDGDAPAETAVELDIEGRQFRPEEVQVDAGTTVTWANRDSVGHDVVVHRVLDAE